MRDSMQGYAKFAFRHGAWARDVFYRGAGPAVIVIHEIPGLHPLVFRFANRLADAGFTVYLPSLFGEPGRAVSLAYALRSFVGVICIRREFDVWSANRSSPIVDWLRALSRRAHQECGGKGVGAIGMCLTGNFALAMMTEPAVIAPALAEPSLPLPVGGARRAALGVSPEELACAKRRLREEDLQMLGLRFKGDPYAPPERFETLRKEFGKRFKAIELNPESAEPSAPKPAHSVLTVHLRDDDPMGETRLAERQVIAFFREALSCPSDIHGKT
ncbi:dienelactone hydrolase family protein [Methylocystis parvus]|uniref:dienelactone hydrolase family protein n=1 Tax=Methylocystis parvus TaxID=134 RepID=UPI003C74738B